ncbi:glycoside hydrolase family 115 protein [Moniliophthora roreri]|nr:glycoside hydrolase family 115 protein [Moniliophthora roreri]
MLDVLRVTPCPDGSCLACQWSPKRALPGLMRLSPPGTIATRPRDNRDQCPNG